MITDLGRTPNLVASSKLEERAQQANALATREDIVLIADPVFYQGLQAQALLQVAQQTVATRQATQGQVDELTANNLRSTLDLTFANVNVSQAQLMQLDAANNASSATAALDEVLGLDQEITYTLIDDAGGPPSAPLPSAQPLIALALRQRPDLQSLGLTQQSAQKFSQAQSDQRQPTVSALGTVGGTPVRPGQYFISSWDGAIGANVNIPIFNGFLYSAQAEEAKLRANVASEQTRQLRDRIVRDVQTAWLQATNAYRRIGVTAISRLAWLCFVSLCHYSGPTLLCQTHPHDHEDHAGKKQGIYQRFLARLNQGYQHMRERYQPLVYSTFRAPGLTAGVLLGSIALVLVVFSPFLGRPYFPRTDPGQFVLNVKMPSGTRIEVSNEYVAHIKSIIRQTVAPKDLDIIVSNIGITPDLSAIYTPNASMDTGFIQVSFKKDEHHGAWSSAEYERVVRAVRPWPASFRCACVPRSHGGFHLVC